MFENTGSAAVLKISANKNSIVQLKKDGILVHQFNNDEGYISILDSNEIVFLYNITQFGTYTLQAEFNGIIKIEKIDINDIKTYYISMCIQVIFKSGHPEYSAYQTLYLESAVTSEITDDYIHIGYTSLNNCGAHIKSYPILINPNTDQKNYSKFIAEIPTKSGCHLITTPFNLQQFKEKYPDIDVHKNNPTLLYCL